jgi:N-glycosylase/DNA lyase
MLFHPSKLTSHLPRLPPLFIRAMSRSTPTLPLSRPPFPSGWSAIPLTPSNLTMANTLPVGQSFLWHRHVLPSCASSSTTTSPTPSLSASAPLGIELEPTEEFSRAVHDPPRVICLRQSPHAVWFTAIHPSPEATEKDRIEGTTKAWLEDYFHLSRHPELGEMYDEWRDRDPQLFGTVDLEGRARGVRVLRQDPWECLVA